MLPSSLSELGYRRWCVFRRSAKEYLTVVSEACLLLAQAVKPVMGKYYREPQKSNGPIPMHLLAPLVRSFKQDHYVEDKGDIVFYKADPQLASK